MQNEVNTKNISFVGFISYLIMLIINILATWLPINGMTTGQISDSFPNLFAPAGLTFSIWGIIYFYLAIYCYYQYFENMTDKPRHQRWKNRFNFYFIISCVANALWILVWHFKRIGLSLTFMIILFIALLLMVSSLKKRKFPDKEYFWRKMPFIIYFAWINIAVIANVTTYLVSIGWNGFGLSKVFWTNIMLTIGFLIGSMTLWWLRDSAYGMIFIWAYAGIIFKHVSKAGYNWSYQSIIFMAFLFILGFLAMIMEVGKTTPKLKKQIKLAEQNRNRAERRPSRR